MNTSELYSEIAKRSGLHRTDVAKVMDTFMETLLDSVMVCDEVKLTGLGRFHVSLMPEANRCFMGKKYMTIPEHYRLHFHPSEYAKKRVRNESTTLDDLKLEDYDANELI